MHYVIIGNSTAAAATVESIRTIDKHGDISMISSENYYCYSKPLISYYLAGKIELKNIYYRSRDFYSDNRIDIHLGSRVTDIDAINKRIKLQFGQDTISYDKLLVATGSMPVIPDALQGDYTNIFTFHSLADVLSIKNYINGRQGLNAVVIGGGLIGLKAAESLIINGQKVTVVEAGSHILNSILDYDAAMIITNHLESQSVKVICNQHASHVNATGKLISSIVFEEGEEISCDLVIVAAGMKPAVPDVTGAELEVENGILVNEFMQTSLPDVYAAGDVAQGYERLSRTKKLLPIIPSAYFQGQTAGLNMAGHKIASNGQIAFNSIPLLGLSVCTAGISNPGQGDYELLTANKNHQHKRMLIKNNTLQGFVLINAIERAGIYRNIIEKKVDISSFKSRLLADNFGLADLPEEFSREVVFHDK